jgi:hypothetical protein
LHRAQNRRVSGADTEPDAQPVRHINFHQAARHAGENQARSREYHAGDRKPAGTEAVGERTAHDAEAEVEKSGQRKHQRDRTARSVEILLQRREKRAERIGAAEAGNHHRKRGCYHHPAVENTRLAWRRIIACRHARLPAARPVRKRCGISSPPAR